MRLSVPLGNFFTTRKQSPSLLRVTQWTPASLSTPRCTKSTYARSKMTISPALTPAQTCAARMLSAALADSTNTKRGSRLCKSSRTWSLAAALRRRCSSPIDAGGDQGDRAGVHHVNDAPQTDAPALYLGVLCQSREKGFGGARAPPRTTVRPTPRHDVYWRGKGCCDSAGLPRARPKAARGAAAARHRHR